GVFVGAQLPDDTTGHRQPAFDITGAMLLMLTVAGFAFAATLSPLNYINGVLAGGAALSAAAFVRVESRASAPLVQLQMLKRPEVGAGLLSIGLVSTIVMTTLVVGPFYLTSVLALDLATAGVVMSVGP